MSTPQAAPALVARNVSKTFGATRALRNVDIQVEAGEVVAVLGQNGSGKSTLVKVLSGYHVPDPGAELSVGGRKLTFPLAPGSFHDVGMSFVYQDLGLAPGMTVHESLTIGSRKTSFGHGARPILWWKEHKQTEVVLRRYGVTLDPRKTVRELPPLGRALLAIVRAAEELREFRDSTGRTHSLLILDEPTVFLPAEDLEFLFNLVRTVTASGASVIFISHDLEAVRSIADRMVVLRDGEVRGSARVADLSEDEVIEMIVGSAQERFEASAQRVSAGAARKELERHGTAAQADYALVVEGLAGGSVEAFDLAVRPGEVVGVAGLVGSGTDDVPYLIFGGLPATAGTVTVGGRKLRAVGLTTDAAMEAGIALVPSDRARDGVVPAMTVEENVLMLTVDRYYRGGRVRRGDFARDARSRAEEFDIRPRNTSLDVRALSGGNQQKVVLAKWLETAPDVLILHEPSQGVDVGARAEIWDVVRDTCASRGMGVVWITTDFGELAAMAHRVLVLAGGRIAAELAGEQITKEGIDEAVVRSGTRV